MSYSFQTNVTSLAAQENIRVNGDFQARTITRLTSGFRINSSGDDAAGLAVANGLRSKAAELQQGVRNANDGISVFQTIDGGLNDITQIVDRLRTLATQSASSTFSGDRGTVNNEYQSLLAEITRQASNIGLNTGGAYNTNIGVYIGGGSSAANAQVSVDLSGSSNAVDATSLGLVNSTVAGGGVGITGNLVQLDTPGASFLASGSQAFTFNVATATGAASAVAITVTGGAGGLTANQVLAQLNAGFQQNNLGISASIGSDGKLQFSGTQAFTLAAVGAAGAGNAAATATSTIAANTSDYNVSHAFTAIAANSGQKEQFTVQSGSQSVNIVLNDQAGTTAADTIGHAIQSINTQLAVGGVTGVTAVLGANGTSISLQGPTAFSINQTTTTSVNTVTSAAFTGITGPGTETFTINGTTVNLNKTNAGSNAAAVATIQAAIGAPATSGITVAGGGGNTIVITSGNNINGGALTVSQTAIATTYSAASTVFTPLTAGHTETFSLTGAGVGATTFTLVGTAGNATGGAGANVASDGTSVFAAVASLNAQFLAAGSSAVATQAGANIVITAPSSFTITGNAGTGPTAHEGFTVGGVEVATIAVTGVADQNAFAANGAQASTPSAGGGVFTAQGVQAVTSAAASSTGTANALSALVALGAAVQRLGLIQGRVGAGENVFADAINLAQSQITNSAAAESRIRDSDVAAEAANLTKAQVLLQSSVAALAQANTAPQALLKLLQ